MLFAMEQAEIALQCGEIPVGCVIIHNDKVLTRGHNKTNETKNGTK